MTYGSFSSFVESVVIPQKSANPAHIRLDGNTSGGSWNVAGIFRHHDKFWQVHDDTHYEPLLLAYDLMKKGMVNDPFIEEITTTGKRKCLVLQDTIRRLMAKPRFKHLYIYEA